MKAIHQMSVFIACRYSLIVYKNKNIYIIIFFLYSECEKLACFSE